MLNQDIIRKYSKNIMRHPPSAKVKVIKVIYGRLLLRPKVISHAIVFGLNLNVQQTSFYTFINFLCFDLPEHLAEDDSDMMMEPDEQYSHSIDTSYHPLIPSYIDVDRPQVDDAQPQAANGYFPPYVRDAPPLGHSRPYFQNDAQIEPQNQREAPRQNWDQTILGSGDFGVIRGGTFYADDDPPINAGVESKDYYSYYKDNNNGHGRPHAEPLVQAKQATAFGDDQFANFRDFADINTPADPAYSQLVVIYANKNSTAFDHPNPKNIFEQLTLLDREVDAVGAERDGDVVKPSKTKLKLATTKLTKKYTKRVGPKDQDQYEPLLALS